MYKIFQQDWERCERGIGGSLEKLRAFKRQLSQPLPDHHEDLQAEQMRCKVTDVLFKRCFFVQVMKSCCRDTGIYYQSILILF